MRARFGLLLGLALTACGSPEPSETAPPPPDGGTGGEAGSEACPAGTQPLADGSCLPAGSEAGVPAELCGEGFESDASGGCVAILPSADCPDGELAVPGDETCRELQPCGDAPWGSISLEPSAGYVDGSFGGASDGSASAPWTTITAAVNAAADGDMIAVAAGTYTEDLRLEGKAVRLFGRCPRLVRIVGAGVQPATVSIIDTAGVELHGVAVSGPRAGVWVRNSADFVADSVWVDGTQSYGLVLRGPSAEGVVTQTLIESARSGGVVLHGGSLELARSVVRESRSDNDGLLGYGLTVQIDTETGHRGRLSAVQSVIARNLGVGAIAYGGELRLESCVVQDTAALPGEPSSGQGVQARFDPSSATRGSVELVSTVIERSVQHGLAVAGSDALIDATVVRDVSPGVPEGDRGWGVLLGEDIPAAEPTQAVMTRSLIERTVEAGVYVQGGEAELDRVLVRDVEIGSRSTGRGVDAVASEIFPNRTRVALRSSLIERCGSLGALFAGVDATIESTWIRNIDSGVDGQAGYGLAVQHHFQSDERSEAIVRWSLIEQAHGAGLLVTGSEATIELTAVRDVVPEVDGDNGIGIGVQYAEGFALDGRATIRSCSVDNTHDTGILVIGASAVIEDTSVTNTHADGNGGFGDGIATCSHHLFQADAVVMGCHVGASARAGVASFGGNVELSGSEFECNAIDLDGEFLNGRGAEFADLGGNACGCGPQIRACAVLSSSLQAPDPVQ